VRVEVVLDEHGDAVERARGGVFLARLVEPAGDRFGVGVGLDDRVHRGARAVDRLDPLQEVGRQRGRGHLPGPHRREQVGDAGLVPPPVGRAGAVGRAEQ
jgi:hypothetical protein